MTIFAASPFRLPPLTGSPRKFGGYKVRNPQRKSPPRAEPSLRGSEKEQKNFAPFDREFEKELLNQEIENPAAIETVGLQTNKVFANPEDAAGFGKEDAKKYIRTDESVERVRRAHLNDLENIVPFVGIGLLYSLSGPDLSTALLHFRIFVGARIYHTVAYLLPLPQPNRGLAFFVGFGVTLSMAYSLLRNKLYL
ncbi:microsomal glutathione S-transferase 1 [Octodon degus]|uniref:Microsomal glutathione S-transferase 1 n=1 Tax=Octodon degus TaxID=10160 RepID=A0A6P6DZP0_OCTDE|nr:microsomal glutathione S-transferase 1 [Octodon degus]